MAGRTEIYPMLILCPAFKTPAPLRDDGANGPRFPLCKKFIGVTRREVRRMTNGSSERRCQHAI
jgi:hypothetical protein